MRYLHDSGYQTYKVGDLAEDWPDVLQVEKGVVLTFDDGLYNNFTIVCDVLRRFNMTATFFVVTENIGNQRSYPRSPGLSYFRDTLGLCWDDIRLMRKEGFEIASHSHSHEMITQLSEAEAGENIASSKRMIEGELNIKVESFSYPYGRRNAYAPWTKAILKGMGFKAGCTQAGGALSKDADLLELPRIAMRGSDSLEVFKHKLAGYYDFLRWL